MSEPLEKFKKRMKEQGIPFHRQYMYAEPIAATPELSQCQRCWVYTNDPEHYCGSVALVTGADGPRVWKYIFDSIFFINTTIL